MNLDKFKPLTSQLEEIVSEIPGWTPIDQLVALFNFVVSSGLHSSGDILELGSWCGRSSVVLGIASRSIGTSNVHCVDLFPEKADWYENEDGTHSFKVIIGGRERVGCNEQTVWKEPFMKDVMPVYNRWPGTLEAFNYHIQEAGLENIVMPFRGEMRDFFKHFNQKVKIRLAFLDGDHSYKAVCDDIRYAEELLVPGGWLCFDDAFSVYDGVNKAIEEKIISSGNYDYYQQITRKLFVARHK